MREAQDRFEHAHQRAARGALLGFIAAMHLYFCQLYVPVAVFVPHQFVERARQIVEAVFAECPGHVGFRALQAADDPSVSGGIFQRCLFVQPHVFAIAVHQHKARGVPQLVAEIAIAVTALQIELDVAPR